MESGMQRVADEAVAARNHRKAIYEMRIQLNVSYWKTTMDGIEIMDLTAPDMHPMEMIQYITKSLKIL